MRRAGWRDWVWRLVLHVATGVLAVAVHYGVMALCMKSGLSPVAASGVGFVCGAVTRFYTAYFHVYSPESTARTVAPRFVLALAVQFAVNALMLDGLIGLGLPVWWAQAATTVLLAFGTYLVYRLLVFT